MNTQKIIDTVSRCVDKRARIECFKEEHGVVTIECEVMDCDDDTSDVLLETEEKLATSPVVLRGSIKSDTCGLRRFWLTFILAR